MVPDIWITNTIWAYDREHYYVFLMAHIMAGLLVILLSASDF